MRPVLLCILDGWGIGDDTNPSNAIAQAKLENYSRILKTYPHSRLETSGLAVGLPDGQIGNSEVGHSTIGAGRVIFQDLPRINNAILDGSLAQNHDLLQLALDLQKSGRAAHLLGLISDGGVHSHQKHIIYLAKFLAQRDIQVYIHAFLDGRDVAQKSALEYLAQFFDEIGETPFVKLATISGRYYAMDRDNKWDRIELAYNAIMQGQEGEKQRAIRKKYQLENFKGTGLEEALAVVESYYEEDLSDEFVLPFITNEYKVIQDGDALISCNFRADRIRQLSTAMLDSEFDKFTAKKINFSHKIAMSEYSVRLNNFYKILFPAQEIKNSLPELLETQGLKQLRIAETEKYAHVTFFFSCGIEKEMRGEKRILIKSPSVATYDLKPEMSSVELGEKLRAAINSDEFNFIIVNYANADMVGHSGNLSASIKACQAIDVELAKLEEIILQKNGVMLISADHGNIECMKDKHGAPHTSHTTNLVPFILIGRDVAKIKLRDGSLGDIAPTILQLMKITQPKDMTGKSLIVSL